MAKKPAKIARKSTAKSKPKSAHRKATTRKPVARKPARKASPRKPSGSHKSSANKRSAPKGKTAARPQTKAKPAKPVPAKPALTKADLKAATKPVKVAPVFRNPFFVWRQENRACHRADAFHFAQHGPPLDRIDPYCGAFYRGCGRFEFRHPPACGAQCPSAQNPVNRVLDVFLARDSFSFYIHVALIPFRCPVAP